MNNLYYIVNEKGQKVRFRMNRVQLLLFKALWYLNIVLKSRQHGVTTFFCIYFLDVALFNSNVRCGIIAHNREDAQSFFADKVKYAYDNLPDEIKLARHAKSDSSRELKFSNDSAIRVGVSMRSGTYQYLHISEFGKICKKYPEKAKEIVTGALNTVHVGQFITIESTAEGNEGYFYDYCQDAKKKKMRGVELTPMDFKFFFFAWWQDPRNKLDDVSGVVLPAALKKYFAELRRKFGIELTASQKAWYAKKWTTQGELMKREHPSTADEAFEASVEGAYFATQFARIYKENRILRFPVEDGIKVDTWWDLGMDDTTDIWFTQTVGREIRLIDFYEAAGEGLAHYAQVLDEKGYRYGRHVAPHDIEVRELGTGVSRKKTAKKYGISFEVAPKLSKLDQIQAARDILQHCYFHESNCVQKSADGKRQVGIPSLENYRKEWDDKLGCFRQQPLHNWASNGADAFLTLGVAHKFKTNTKHFTPNRRRAA